MIDFFSILIFTEYCIYENSHVNNLIGAKTETENVTGWDLTEVHCCDQSIKEGNGYMNDCGNGNDWFGFKSEDSIGSIKTKLKGCGTGRLEYGNCYSDGFVRVVLDGIEIDTAVAGEKKEIMFDFNNGSELKLYETYAIIHFIKFEVLNCKECLSW